MIIMTCNYEVTKYKTLEAAMAEAMRISRLYPHEQFSIISDRHFFYVDKCELIRVFETLCATYQAGKGKIKRSLTAAQRAPKK